MEAIKRFDLFRILFIFSIIFFIATLSFFILSFVYIFLINKINLNTHKVIRKDLSELNSNSNLNSLGHLFVSNVKSDKNNQPIAPQPINFVLLGTLITDKSKSAIIKIDDKVKVVRNFGKIAENVILIGVNEFYILIDINGTKKIVELNREFKQEVPKDKIPPLSDIVPIPQGASNYVVDKRMVDDLTKDMGQFLKDIRIIPYFENGVTAGFKFEYVKPDSFFAQNGIKQGDKLVSINGNKVTTTEDSFKLYNLLRTERYISLVVDGEGGRRTINYEIR
jgi:general secretion pathway protein C